MLRTARLLRREEKKHSFALQKKHGSVAVSSELRNFEDVEYIFSKKHFSTLL